MNDDGPPSKRSKASRDDLDRMSKDELIKKCAELEDELMSHRGDPNEKLKLQQTEAARRENVLVMRLASKEQEMQDYLNQIAELKAAQNTNVAQLRSMLLDPAINLMFHRMKKEADSCKDKLEQAQNDLAAWKFTPDSQTGKRLMARCRTLLQENAELGKEISSGRTAKLEGEIALQTKLVGEMQVSQAELDEFMAEIEDETECMSSMIISLQQELQEAKTEIERLRTSASTPTDLGYAPPHRRSHASEASTEETGGTSSDQSTLQQPTNGASHNGGGGVRTPKSGQWRSSHRPGSSSPLSDDTDRVDGAKAWRDGEATTNGGLGHVTKKAGRTDELPGNSKHNPTQGKDDRSSGTDGKRTSMENNSIEINSLANGLLSQYNDSADDDSFM